MSDTTQPLQDGAGPEQQKGDLTVSEALAIVPPLNAAKAFAGGIVSTLVAFLSTLQMAVADGSGVSASEWITIALATVIGAAAGFGITYAVPSRAK